jgi:hypothetical protein
MNGNMGIIGAVAKLSSSHPALLAWTSALLHRTAMHDNRLVLMTQKYTTTGGIEERSFVAALLWMTAKSGLDGGRDF